MNPHGRSGCSESADGISDGGLLHANLTEPFFTDLHLKCEVLASHLKQSADSTASIDAQ